MSAVISTIPNNSNNLDTPEQKPILDQPKSRIDELTDQPCAIPRY